jgi:hypothetical protein
MLVGVAKVGSVDKNQWVPAHRADTVHKESTIEERVGLARREYRSVRHESFLRSQKAAMHFIIFA